MLAILKKYLPRINHVHLKFQVDVVDARQILFEDRQHRRFAAFGIPGVAGVEQQESISVRCSSCWTTLAIKAGW